MMVEQYEACQAYLGLDDKELATQLEISETTLGSYKAGTLSQLPHS